MSEAMKEKRERAFEAHKELEHLQERGYELSKILTPQAIMAVWLLLGDEMWLDQQPEATA
jgi:hypothetical protein